MQLQYYIKNAASLQRTKPDPQANYTWLSSTPSSMSKLHGNYSDGGRNGSYAVTGYADHVRRPGMVVEPEGRRNPNTGYSSEGYVVRTERIVEHITHAPVISIVRPDPYWPYGADHEPEMENYGVQDRYSHPNYGHPMENFLTKIQTEVSRPQPATKIPGPLTTNWRTGRVSTGQEHQPNNHSTARSDADDHKGKNGHQMQKKIQTVPIGNLDKNTGGHPNPVPNKHNFYERPNESHFLPTRPLSRPTNDINGAVEVLAEGVKGANLGVPWRKGIKGDSDGDDHLNEQRGYHRMDSPQRYHDEESLPVASQKQHQPRFGVPPAQPKKEVTSYSSGSDSDTIDSGEARKRYGNLKPQPVQEKAYKGAITSDDLIKKYNGAKVPW